MCGINGFVDKGLSTEEAEAQLDRMSCLTHHRGPDNTGSYHLDAVHLGHNRLSIIDLSHDADQPFRRGDLVMTYNGEVYNYVELRAELERAGHRFVTHSDTEVILAAYEDGRVDYLSK